MGIGIQHLCSLAVETEFFLIMITVTDFFFLQSQAIQPVQADLFPLREPFQVCIRFAEELQLHLLKLTGTESKVSGSNLITEGFSDLGNTKWQFLSGSSLYVFKVYKNSLGRLRS